MVKPAHSSKIHPSLDRKPGISNWVDAVGGLPSYIDRIAKHIHSDSGLSISRAVAAAVNRVKQLAAKGNAQAIRALAEWEAKRGRAKAKDLSLGEDLDIIDLAIIARRRGTAPTAITSGVRGAAFDEAKHVRSGQGKFANKLSPSELIAARAVIEGRITNLRVGQSYTLPDRLGYVKRTPGGYFVQGSGGYTASVRTLSAAIQAAAVLLAGKVQVTR
jgi:hypothetical protein